MVEGIIHSFLLKRLLIDVIRSRDVAGVRNVIDELQDFSLLHTTLDQPVDSLLNTPLHIAVQVGCAGVVRVLLQHGASPALRNLRGDLANTVVWDPPRSARGMDRSVGTHPQRLAD